MMSFYFFGALVYEHRSTQTEERYQPNIYQNIWEIKCPFRVLQQNMQIEFDYQHCFLLRHKDDIVLSPLLNKAVLSLLKVWPFLPVLATSVQRLTIRFCELTGICKLYPRCLLFTPVWICIPPYSNGTLWGNHLHRCVWYTYVIYIFTHSVEFTHMQTLTTSISFGWHTSH